MTYGISSKYLNLIMIIKARCWHDTCLKYASPTAKINVTHRVGKYVKKNVVSYNFYIKKKLKFNFFLFNTLYIYTHTKSANSLRIFVSFKNLWTFIGSQNKSKWWNTSNILIWPSSYILKIVFYKSSCWYDVIRKYQ